MVDALIFAQTFFYFAASLAIIIFGVLFFMIAYYLLSIAKHLNKLSEDLDKASDDVRQSIEDIITRLSVLPIFSFFFQKEANKKKYKK